MQKELRIFWDSFGQAWQQLSGNKLRTLLSLMGITIGIFCIISVKSAVNSLEDDMRKSLSKLGDNILYVTKMPWGEDPGANFWKYMRRPAPSYAEFKYLKEKLHSAELVAFSYFLGAKTLKWDENSVNPGYLIGVTQDYGPLFNITIANGRYFTEFESEKGQAVAVIGHILAGKLFGAVDPVGRDIQVMGKQMRIVGVIEKEGESILRVAEFDDALLIPIEFGRQFANIKGNGFNTFIGLRPFKGANFESFKDETAFHLRSKRRIRPYEDNSFATNEIKLIQALLDSVFSILNLAGFLIGIFAIIVGMFSVANIMFVSVKERTNLIGIKKAIGATKMVILLEILIESVLLCLAGGVVGLILVGLLMLLASYAFEFNMYLSFYNAFTGVLMSVVVGIMSGMIPAIQASNLDPVEAIRQ